MEPEPRKKCRKSLISKSWLSRFIEKFILCRKCSIPEIKITVKKGFLYGDCRACGASELIENKHKLVAYVLKNPPKDVSEFKGKDEEAQADGKKKKGKKGKKGQEEGKDIEKDSALPKEEKEEEKVE